MSVKEERMEILQMLKEGKISIEESETLLSALDSSYEKESKRSEQKYNNRGSNFTGDIEEEFINFGKQFKDLKKILKPVTKEAIRGVKDAFKSFNFKDLEGFGEIDGEKLPYSSDGITIEPGSEVHIRVPPRNKKGGDLEVERSDSDKLEFQGNIDNLDGIYRKDNRYIIAIISNAKILIPNTASKVSVSIPNGDINIKSIDIPLVVHTMNGDINAEQVSSNSSCSTMNGDINITHSTALNTDNKLSTMSGDISVSVLEDSNGTIQTQTMSGDITTPTESETIKSFIGKQKKIILGMGNKENTLLIKTMSGDIKVELSDTKQIEEITNADA